MAESISAIELSPLDQIRLAEAEITRKTVAARENAERRLAEVHTKAARIKKLASEEGTRVGKVDYKEIVSRAAEEASAITANAQNQADILQQKGHSRMEMAVEYAVSIVLGLNINGRDDDP